MHHGDPELPGAVPMAPAVFRVPDGARVGAVFGAGGSSADYAARFGALHLVTEVPSWVDDRVSDRSETGRPYREIVTAAAAARREAIETLESGLRDVTGDLTVHSPFRRSTEGTLEAFRRFGELEESVPGLDRPATVAEEFGHRQAVHLVRLRLLGTFLRMLDAELAAGNPTPAIREQRRLLGERFDLWYAQAEADSPGPPVEIRRVVAVQLGAALVAAERAVS
ncbi:hypothetical protein [Nonomuraea sp. NPDC049480]|uniref:hypothetical protein n=1 Tax=Nonomuraea sp. NPDC049480 TaxID=3364353 RepID=UPI0037ACAB22